MESPSLLVRVQDRHVTENLRYEHGGISPEALQMDEREAYRTKEESRVYKKGEKNKLPYSLKFSRTKNFVVCPRKSKFRDKIFVDKLLCA